ncbi:hypothetical protein BABINDRAFT_107981 [Babjeviella inositovora NRRL Y-12698]|uniref:Uncharacterized protein n=1 Tax=Babjeviella inositovora NRRL Y-12698 TaxID=984486 RepID=A0A1E3QUZ6_9ASCO|nr:uncharacterized protein BABINDRAFT_107981 [Babjeviella inositovora NRRL Y-12698]ODQ81488.1 hypothetical protein BABINDRAFT_107981 [Babjeviella inositovora NRRL Y-12698]
MVWGLPISLARPSHLPRAFHTIKRKQRPTRQTPFELPRSSSLHAHPKVEGWCFWDKRRVSDIFLCVF